MNKKLSKHMFNFEQTGYGHYRVTYTTPSGRFKYRATINYMPLIDAVKWEDYPAQKAMSELAYSVRYHGSRI